MEPVDIILHLQTKVSWCPVHHDIDLSSPATVDEHPTVLRRRLQGHRCNGCVHDPLVAKERPLLERLQVAAVAFSTEYPPVHEQPDAHAMEFITRIFQCPEHRHLSDDTRKRVPKTPDATCNGCHYHPLYVEETALRDELEELQADILCRLRHQADTLLPPFDVEDVDEARHLSKVIVARCPVCTYAHKEAARFVPKRNGRPFLLGEHWNNVWQTSLVSESEEALEKGFSHWPGCPNTTDDRCRRWWIEQLGLSGKNRRLSPMLVHS